MDRLIQLLQSITRCKQSLKAHLASAAQPHDLSDSEFHLLWSFLPASASAASQNDLAAWLGVSAAQVSSLVERLRKKGWITGQRTATDRRRQVWQLTPAGRAVVEAVSQAILARHQSLSADLHSAGFCDAIANLDRLALVLQQIDRDLQSASSKALVPAAQPREAA